MPHAEEPTLPDSRAASPAVPRPAAGREAAGWLLLAGAVGVLVRDAWLIQHPIDDAYISYRYAANLVAGHGLVYNPGEYVEGFTNLLWTLLVALGIAVGLPAPATGWLLGIASGAAALYAGFALARGWLPPQRAFLAGLVPWIVVATPAFPRWSMSGLETPLFTATVTGALATLAAGRIGWTTGLVLLATLTRPDGALLAAVVFGWHLWRRGREGPAAWVAPALYAAALAALTGFRLAYYGSPVPNTFYAKVGGIPMIFGVYHVRGFLAGGAGWLLLPAAFAVVREARARPAALYAVAVAAYVVWIGGDVFAHRFLLPLLPALAALAIRGASDAFDRLPRPAAVALSATLPLAALQMLLGGLPAAGEEIGAWLRPPHRTRYIERILRIDRGFEARGKHAARVLQERSEQPQLVAAGAIGAFGYFSGLPVLDLYGLTDATIARTEGPEAKWLKGYIPGHQRSNADYVMARRPDYILVPQREDRLRGLVPAHDALWDHPDLDRWYDWDEAVKGYRRRLRPLEAP